MMENGAVTAGNINTPTACILCGERMIIEERMELVL
jgi:hypothetical protein